MDLLAVQKLQKYSPSDIYFLKSSWRQYLREGRADIIQKRKGLNLQCVYALFDLSKLFDLRKISPDQERYVAILRHSPRYKLEIFFIFDTPEEGKLGIITYIKSKI